MHGTALFTLAKETKENMSEMFLLGQVKHGGSRVMSAQRRVSFSPFVKGRLHFLLMKPSCSRSFRVHMTTMVTRPEGLSKKLYDLDEKRVSEAVQGEGKRRKKTGLPRLRGHGDDKQKHFGFCFQAPPPLVLFLPFQAQEKIG